MAIQDQINRITNEVGTQSGIIANIKDTLSDLDDGLTAMSEEVSELVDMPEEVNLTTMTEGVAAANGEIVVQSELIEQIRDALQGKAISGKEEQKKSITVTENGSYKVLPDENKVLSEVNVEVGVKEEFVGIKLLNFENGLPTILDMRDLPVTESFLSQDKCFANLCYDCGLYKQIREVYIPDGLTVFSTCMFYNTPVATIYGDLTKIKKVHDYAFQRTALIGVAPYLPNVEFIGYRAFDSNTKLNSVYLFNKQVSISANAYDRCSNLTDIYVPWAEGAVANAPWGATNATIHYNTQYDADGNPIIEEV